MGGVSFRAVTKMCECRSPASGERGLLGSPYIAVSMPWPFGVIMLSQLPLATYFQWPGS